MKANTSSPFYGCLTEKRKEGRKSQVSRYTFFSFQYVLHQPFMYFFAIFGRQYCILKRILSLYDFSEYFVIETIESRGCRYPAVKKIVHWIFCSGVQRLATLSTTDYRCAERKNVGVLRGATFAPLYRY